MDKATEKSTPPKSPPREARRNGSVRKNGNGNGNGHALVGEEALNKRQLLAGLRALQRGEFDVKLPDDLSGIDGQICETFNELVQFAANLRTDVVGLRQSVGIEGRTHRRLGRSTARGGWSDYVSGLNELLDDVTAHTTDVARVLSAVAKGDLGQTIDVEGTDTPLRGDFLRHARLVNGMVSQLAAFASEVTRVAQEVGVDGKLGAQARIRGVSGVWKELTDSVNLMASNLTNQVRSIAKVVTAVARGELRLKLVGEVLEARGEIAELADTINSMIDTLALFADQVTTVAREVGIEGKLGGQANVPGSAGIWRDLTDNVNQLAGNLTTQVRAIAEVSTAVAQGDLTRSITVHAAGEVAALKDNVNQMIKNLQETTSRNMDQDWLKTNLAKLTRVLQGQRDLMAVSRSILSEVAPLVGAQHGAFYLAETDGTADSASTSDGHAFRLLAGYAFRERKGLSNRFRVGEGLVGQCALEKDRILIMDTPPDYVQIGSGLGESKPRTVVVQPIVFEGNVKAIVELASFGRFTEIQLAFLEQLSESIGIVLNTISAGMRTEELLKQSQALTEELQSQQEELTETNIRLESQAKTLRESEELLKKQQEELQQANEELEERAELLSQQKTEVEDKNSEVERARGLIQEKAEQLALTSKYKSEFLANMSHELRTPLNSMLILSKTLWENIEGNLSNKQTEYARTIHSSGADLLALINDILDLSKIEAGSMDVEIAEVGFAFLRDFCEHTFRPVAEQRKLDFSVAVNGRLPATLRTDGRRLQQVLKNLLSNAFKFTEKGRVELDVTSVTEGWGEDQDILNRADHVIAFSVKDSGIGIPPEKQQIIFEAFQQADGTTSRKYGGTGLGLSISREIARLLGGCIRVDSQPGRGSTFILFLPLRYVTPPKRVDADLGRADSGHRQAHKLSQGSKPAPALPARTPASAPSAPLGTGDWDLELEDDRESLTPEDRVLLIVEDDRAFAEILLEMARARGFKGVVAGRVESALLLLGRIKVDAITLDLKLPDRDGWVVLDRLKHDPRTRHIPVHIMSVEDEERRGLQQGAMAYLHKPVSKEGVDAALDRIKSFVDRPVKKLLVVEDNDVQRKTTVDLIGNRDVHTTAVATGGEALKLLGQEKFDCMVLDLGLPDIPGLQLIQQIEHELHLKDLPIIVYTGKELSKQEETELRMVAEAIVVKGVKSPERLIDETALFLHRVEANLPEPKRRVIEQLRKVDETLSGRKVLIIDDDVRNIFALSTVLGIHGMSTVHAENGKDGIAALKQHPEIEAVLTDIMMPEMDGYETMRAIRSIPQFKSMPIIALTAKAMKGDREKCIEAGASDYVAKPVDVEQLLSLLRVWLYR
jgi:signal transduction histidine kinase/CheY-like chemotaxis protein/HAMP domain-containing protein